MGRTVLPFSQVLALEQREWQKFRRALRQEDQAAFDELFESARKQTQAGAYEAAPDPFAAVLLSMLVEMQKGSLALKRRIERLEQMAERPAGATNQPHN